MAGIQLWMGSISGFGTVEMMVQKYSGALSGSALGRQVDHSPAKANSSPDFKVIRIIVVGNLLPLVETVVYHEASLLR